MKLSFKKYSQGFTIVELLVVIVVIGILAAITIVSYSGITNRANIAAIQAELSGASKKLAMYYAANGFYPSAIDSGTGCPTAPVADSSNCLNFSGGASYAYTRTSDSKYEITLERKSLSYKITENSSPVVFYPWLTIGTQIWAKQNVNIGIMIDGGSNQSNDGVVEKYCYENQPTNCDTYGGLYQWNEAIQNNLTEGAQGVCPNGSHVPSDGDWKTLEKYLGMTQLQADATGLRGTDQGVQLKPGGLSGFSAELGGIRSNVGVFYNFELGFFWTSSTPGGGSAWRRYVSTYDNRVERGTSAFSYALSVRCLKN